MCNAGSSLQQSEGELTSTTDKNTTQDEAVKEDNEIDMDLSDSGVYTCTVKVPLRKKPGGQQSKGPIATFNQGPEAQDVKELLIYAPGKK
ncbi:hypothetical protein BgAZ_102430 [Babesia gibsoni]|uniref:Uncharacterized protein n=1 Tax=Babesia gibsoni TaxID=33632 RepID=A0AAD8PFJ2_BABGI|nr:hypothetical protein BgAZ_102430 [Babesia gibsoni]